MGTNYQFRKNHYFYLSFHPKSKTNYSIQWKINFNKKIFTTAGTDFLSNRNLLQKLPSLMCGKRYCVLQKKVVKSKTLFQLIQIKFLASENHSLPYFQISCSENIFLNEPFIPASGTLFSIKWKPYAFVQSIFSDVGNHC